jgi:hypothetical protein
MNYGRIVMALAMSAILSLCGVASAQQNPHWLGTTGSGFTAGLTRAPQSNISLTATYSNASYGTGGVALRNRIKGSIHISGVTGPTQAAWLYWAVLFASTPSSAQLKGASKVQLQREFPPGIPSGAQLTGTLIAIGGDPCWGSAGTWVFRASVPTTVATGNGLYRVILNKNSTGLSDGEDPWDGNVVFPLAEGASLVIVGTGVASVGLVDGQAGTTFSAAYSNSYDLPAPATGGLVLFDNFGYDGQIGTSRTITASNETTTVQGFPGGVSVLVAGPGGETGDSDWDGSSGWPLPQLWDDTGHDITNAFAVGDTSVLVSYTSTRDCIGTVGAVISVQ